MDDQQSLAGSWLAWMRDRWADFVNLQTTIADLQHRAAVASAQARAAGNADAAEAGKQAIARLNDLAQLHLTTMGDLQAVASEIPGFDGLGAFPLVPLAIAAAVIAACGAAAFIFAHVSAEERVVQLLEAGNITPEQAQSILADVKTPGPGQTAGTIVKWAAVAVLGFLGIQLLKEFGA